MSGSKVSGELVMVRQTCLVMLEWSEFKDSLITVSPPSLIPVDCRTLSLIPAVCSHKACDSIWLQSQSLRSQLTAATGFVIPFGLDLTAS